MRKQHVTFVIILIIMLPLSPADSQSNGFTNSNGSNLSSSLDDGSSWIINWDNYSRDIKAIVTDTSENVYYAGVIDIRPRGSIAPPKIVSIFISKINSSGIEEWTLEFDDAYYSVDLELDADNNIYSLWEIYSLWDNSYESLLIKLNSSGSLIWNLTLTNSFRDLYLDQYENIHLLGYERRISEGFLRLIKLNKSGGMQYNYSFSIDLNPYSLRLDELNNTYIASYVYDLQRIGLYRVNSSDELILVKELDQGRNFSGFLFDDSGNLHIFGIGGSYSNILFKFNSSGDSLFNTTWKSYSTGIYQSFWDHIAIDTSGNIYCGGLTRYYTLTQFSEIFLVVFAENGSLIRDYIWRKYHHTSLNDIHIDQQDNVYFAGYSEKGPFIVKNPSLDDYSIYIFYFYLDEDSLSTFVGLSIFFSVWSLLGISLYIYYIRKSKR